jgi:hypothetical protein
MCWNCDKESYINTALIADVVSEARAAVHLQAASAASAFDLKLTNALVDGASTATKVPGADTLLVVTADSAGDGIGVAPGNPILTVGTHSSPVAHTVSTLDQPGDQDYFQVVLEAGKSYHIGMYTYAGGPSLVPLADPYIEVRTANGTAEGYLVVSADGGATTAPNNVNSGLDVLLTFEPTVTGTYYINARAFGNAGGPNGDEVGDYEIFVDDVTNDPTIYRPYYSPDSPLYSIDWGTQVNRVNQSVRNPDGNEGTRDTGNDQGTVPSTNPNIVAGKNVITIYFAREGDTFVSEDPTNPGLPPALVSVGTQQWEKDTVWTALAQFSQVADIVYIEVDTREEADFIFTTYSGTPGPGISLLGSMSPPDYYDEGLAQFNSGDYRWTEQNLQQGGFSYVTLLHEFGHGHGLAHPHDNGGYSGEMRGVEGIIDTPAGEVPDPTGVYPNYTLGEHQLNQGVYTIMSYMDGWQTSPYGNAATDAGYGYLGTLMAFDIAVIQDKYGVNEEWATGNDTYTMKDENGPGTFYRGIWDAGGIDEIVYSGTRNTTIDLREATLKYEPGGGGYVSYAYGIFGGFTIAKGATIENARTGSGNDTLTGNAVANVLDGGAGNDIFYLSAGGNDTATGGAGIDAFLFGAALTAADQVNGGDGKDQLGMQGNYAAFTFGAGNLVGIETLALLSAQDHSFGNGGSDSSARFSYVLTTVQANVAAGETLTVNMNGLLAGENVTFNGAAETDGAFFFYGGKGIDTLTGGAGTDAFMFGRDGKFAVSDRIDGGAGKDQLGLAGDYTATFTATTMTNVETLALLSASDPRNGVPGEAFNYNITLHDGNVALGQILSVNGNGLRADESMVVNGTTEANGTFRMIGGLGGDTLTGGAGADSLYGGDGADVLRGNGGADTFVYRSASNSTGVNFDKIEAFDYRVDRLDLPKEVSWTSVGTGALNNASFNADLAAAVDGALAPNQGVLFSATSGGMAGRMFAVVDMNGDGSYKAGDDLVIEMVSPAVAIVPTADFVV